MTGKGGVGKSTVAALLGLLAAREGKRVLLLETDPRESLHSLLGCSPSGGDVVAARSRLEFQNLNPFEALDRVIRGFVPVPALAKRVLGSAIYRQVARTMPGLADLALLEAAREALEAEVDLVVLDAPATGHGLALLRAPRLVATAVSKGPVAEAARELSETIEGPRTSVVVVTTPEALPVDETLELVAELEQVVDQGLGGLVVNRLDPLPPGGVEDAGDAARELWLARSLAQREQLNRLNETGLEPDAVLPALPLEAGPVLLEELASVFLDEVDG